MKEPLSLLRNSVRRDRFLSVDSLRGFAMVLVMLQHSYLSRDVKIIPPLFDAFIWNLTSLAAVAFVSISGMMCSYFLYVRSNWRLTYRRYALRAALLILAAHPAINLAGYYFNLFDNGNSPGPRGLLEQLILSFPITDTIGACMLVGPLFIVGLGTGLRGVTILTMLVAAVLVRAFVFPEAPYLVILKEAIFGGLGLPKLFWFPLIPWLAIFLTGSFVGQALAGVKQGTLKVSTLIPEMNRAGIALAVGSIILMIGYKLLKMAFGGVWSPNLFLALYPAQTTTLLPGYLAALLWVLAALMRKIDISGRYDRFAWFLSILGHTSLFTFVIQFAVVESVPAMLGLKGTLGITGFLGLFIIGLAVVWLLSYSYGRLRGWFQKKHYAECVKAAKGQCSGV